MSPTRAAVPVVGLSACSSAQTEPASTESMTAPTTETPVASISVDADDGEYQPATTTSPAKNVPLPEFDEAITEVTEEGMEAAAKYYFDAVNYAMETGSSEALEKISADFCESCFGYQEGMQEMYKSGSWMLTGGLANYQLQPMRGQDDLGDYRINFQITETPSSKIVGGKFQDVVTTTKYASGTIWISYALEYKQWIITDFSVTRVEQHP